LEKREDKEASASVADASLPDEPCSSGSGDCSSDGTFDILAKLSAP
jgi:hypothetical protein